jgi:hypothetical protein
MSLAPLPTCLISFISTTINSSWGNGDSGGVREHNDNGGGVRGSDGNVNNGTTGDSGEEGAGEADSSWGNGGSGGG